MSKSKSELRSETVEKFIGKCKSDESANLRSAFDEAQLTQIQLNNKQTEGVIESERLNNLEREKGLLLLKIEHARRNIDVLIKLRIDMPDSPISGLKKEVLDALKVNIEILNEVKNIK